MSVRYVPRPLSRPVVGALALLLLAPSSALACLSNLDRGPAPGLGASAAAGKSSAADGMPRADCVGGGDPEPGLQGEQPEEHQVAHLQHAYRCNLELVGQFIGDGGNVQVAWHDDCAYMGTLYAPSDPEYNDRKGTVVLDASDPARPTEKMRLKAPALVSPSESLRVNERRGLLGAVQGIDPYNRADGGPWFGFYDIGRQCRQPRLLSSIAVDGFVGHEGDFAPDGRTYYGIDIRGEPNPAVVVLDLDDPTNPKPLLRWRSPLGTGFHSVSFFDDDPTIGYFPMLTGGLAVLDVSDLHSRRPNPEIKVLGELRWPGEGLVSNGVETAKINGRRYAITSDEFGPNTSVAQSCAAGQPPYGSVHIVDVTDVRKPQRVGRISLETNSAEFCQKLERSKAMFNGALYYSPHYCDVDDPQHATALACSWQASGLRVFDIRDLANAREIAYYNPQARPDVTRGSQLKPLVTPADQSWTGTKVRWRQGADGRAHLWFMSMENGLQVVALADQVYRPAAARQAMSTPSPASAGTGAAVEHAAELPATGEQAPWRLVVASSVALAGVALHAVRRRVRRTPPAPSD